MARHRCAAAALNALAPAGGGTAPTETDEAIRERVAAAGTSFYWAMRILPAPRRNAMFAVYAFCREVDDIADEPVPLAEKRAGLARWRAEIDALYAGRPQHVIAKALLRPVGDYALRREDFLAMIDGMEMDAVADIRAPSLAELDLYCARVASAVGHLSVRIFGDASPAADQVAEALGRALQLTNILRDLAEDAARGRLYLPRELLARHGIDSTDPAAVLRHPALPLVCRELAAIARERYAEATRAMIACSRRAMRPAAIMQAVYRATLDRLVAADWRHPDRPVRTPTPVKLWLAVRHGFF
ncbi:MAG: presqualene diphosphate synthase HpnD [Alphaproteobacteria bacterium]|nr:presqualene diphosphate synthase HpnD [Alphaproteobacteria bacterium]